MAQVGSAQSSRACGPRSSNEAEKPSSGSLRTVNAHVRVSAAIRHEVPDRVHVFDQPLPETTERWRREGLPSGQDTGDLAGAETQA